jgi:hypothetical protein
MYTHPAQAVEHANTTTIATKTGSNFFIALPPPLEHALRSSPS